MALTNQQLVAALYITIYSRAPDQAGLVFWTAKLDAGTSLADVAGAMTQHEMITVQPVTVPNMFNNAFNSTSIGSFEGLYWRNELATKPVGTVLAELLQVIFSSDPTAWQPGASYPSFETGHVEPFRQALLNRIDAALTFTNSLGAASNMSPGTVQASKDSLLADPAYQASVSAVVAVTADPASLAAVKSDIAAAVATGNPATTLTSKTLTLTAGTDTFTTSLSNDTFNALAVQDASGNTVNSLQTGDTLKGGAGIDTLNAVMVTGAAAAPVMTGIELLNIRFAAAGTLDLSNSTSFTTITVAGNSAAGTINGVGATSDFIVRNQTSPGAAITFNGSTSAGVSTTLAASGSNSQVSALHLTLDQVGNANSLSGVTLSNAVATGLYVKTSSAYTTLSGVSAAKSLILETSGSNKLVLDQGLLNSVTTLSSSGSNSSVELVGAFTALTSLYAGSSNSINITLTSAAKQVSTSSGNDFITYIDGPAADANITLGPGNDTLILGALPGRGAFIAASEYYLFDSGGYDTLGMRAADYVTMTNTFGDYYLGRITGFEALLLTDSRGLGDGLTIDASKIKGLTNNPDPIPKGLVEVIFAGVTTSSTASVTQLGASSTITLKGDLLANNGALNLSLKDASGTADVLNLTLNENAALAAGSSTAVTVSPITVSGVETINVKTAVTSNVAGVTDAKAVYTLSLNDTALVNLNLSGTQAISYSANAQSIKLASIDASGSSAAVNLNLSAVASTSAALKVTGTALADTFILTNNALVTGGQGADTFVIGTSSTGQSFSTISDIAKGDVIGFSTTALSYQSVKLSLATSATFQDYLNAASASSASGKVVWFQSAGDTYVVEDNSSAGTFQNGMDTLVKLSGLVDLSGSSFNTVNGSLTV